MINLAQISPLAVVLLLALLLLVLGGLAVLFISRDTRQQRPNAPASAAPLPDLETLAPGAAPPAAHTVTLADGSTVPATEVLRVLRHTATGALITQIGGRAYFCPDGAMDGEFSRRYTAIVQELAAMTEPPPPVPAAPPVAREAPPPAPQPAPRPLTPVSMPLPGDLPKFTTPDSKEAPRLGRKPTVAAVPEINIGESIEAYLQYRLETHENLVSRSIHVLPAGEDGVLIEVDGRRYAGIDEIPDGAVQEFLRDAIKDWQHRQ